MRMRLRQVQFVLQHFNRWHCSMCRRYKQSLSVLSTVLSTLHTVHFKPLLLVFTCGFVHKQGMILYRCQRQAFVNTVLYTCVPRNVDKLHASSGDYRLSSLELLKKILEENWARMIPHL